MTWGLVLPTFVILGCGGDTPRIQTGQLEADRLLFERGNAALEERDWIRAREYFVQIRDNYPQSQYRPDTRLAIGDTYEGEGTGEAYVRALDEFRDFLSLYPTHARAGYAQYKLGLIHFHQMRRAERDQSETLNAIEEFRTFVSNYPQNHYLMPLANERLREARDRLSAHYFTVGHFYYRFKSYPGAISRFRELLDNDPDYPRRDEVYFHLADALARINRTAEAIPYFARILEEFESSDYAEEANLRIAEFEENQER